MKLYRLISLASCLNLRRVIKIVKTNKFYCSRFHEMNDPMEGVYKSVLGSNTEKVFNEKNSYRICSFTSVYGFKNPAMWGYYTNGFKGVAIEIEVGPKDSDYNDIMKINYTNNLDIYGTKLSQENDRIVKEILTTKLEAWKHEKECRFLMQSDERFHEIGKIKKVYVGNPYNNIENRNNILANNNDIGNYCKYKKTLEDKLEFLGIPTVEVQIDSETGKVQIIPSI